MATFAKTLKVGDGHEAGVALGPIQNSMQYERVKGFFEEIEKQKQKVVVGGKVEKRKGYFVEPTIIDKPAENSRLVVEEPFGESAQTRSVAFYLLATQVRLSLSYPGMTRTM